MKLYLVTAPSGAGKTTIVKELEKQGYWSECISHTTREMRVGEENGKEYYFVSQEEFQQMVEDGKFAESITYTNNQRYGVSNDEINKLMDAKENVVIIVNYDGYKQVKEIYPDAIGIFIEVTAQECILNMMHRGESKSSMVERLEAYAEEISNRDEYDFVITNERGHLAETLFNFTKLITKEVLNTYK